LEAIGIDVTGSAADQDLHHREITQCGQQHRASGFWVLDFGSGFFCVGPQRPSHHRVREIQVAHPQFIDHVRRGIRFVQHQPHQIRVLGNGLLGRRGDMRERV
jgi:hypothetical protein